MKRLILISALLLTSCSMTPLDLLKPSSGIETNVALGKDVQTEQSTVKVESGNTETKQTADTIENGKQEASNIKNITQNVPIEYLLILAILAGWAIPDPKKCYQGIRLVASEIFTNVIKSPIKGLANFTLALFGREKL